MAEEQWLTLQEVCDILHYSPRKAMDLVRSGELPNCVNPEDSSKVRIPKSSVDNLGKEHLADNPPGDNEPENALPDIGDIAELDARIDDLRAALDSHLVDHSPPRSREVQAKEDALAIAKFETQILQETLAQQTMSRGWGSVAEWQQAVDKWKLYADSLVQQKVKQDALQVALDARDKSTLDAESYAKSMRAQADTYAQAMRSEADTYSQGTRSEADVYAEARRTEGDASLAEATKRQQEAEAKQRDAEAHQHEIERISDAIVNDARPLYNKLLADARQIENNTSSDAIAGRAHSFSDTLRRLWSGG